MHMKIANEPTCVTNQGQVWRSLNVFINILISLSTDVLRVNLCLTWAC